MFLRDLWMAVFKNIFINKAHSSSSFIYSGADAIKKFTPRLGIPSLVV